MTLFLRDLFYTFISYQFANLVKQLSEIAETQILIHFHKGIKNIMARRLDRNALVWGIFTILIATLDVSTKVIDNKYYKQM